MQDYEEVSFMSELDVARVIVGEYIEEKNKPLSKILNIIKNFRIKNRTIII